MSRRKGRRKGSRSKKLTRLARLPQAPRDWSALEARARNELAANAAAIEATETGIPGTKRPAWRLRAAR